MAESVRCPSCCKKATRSRAGRFPVWFCVNPECENNGRMIRKDLPPPNANPRVKEILRDFRNIIYGVAIALAVQGFFQTVLTFEPAGAGPLQVRWYIDYALIAALVVIIVFYVIALRYVKWKFKTPIQFY